MRLSGVETCHGSPGDVGNGMRFTCAGCLALALLLSCGKRHSSPPPDRVPPLLAKPDIPAPAVSKTLPVEAVSPAAPVVPAPMPEDIAPDEEDPSVPDTDQMAPSSVPSPTLGQHVDRAIEKAGKALQNAGDKTEQGVGVAAAKAEKELRKAAAKTGKALRHAGEAIERTLPAGEPDPAPPGQ